MPYKVDLHVHTSETSACGMVPAQEIARLYHEAGYQGIVITDHYIKPYFEGVPAADWREKMDCFLSGWRSAFAEGRTIGLDVYLGIEFRDTTCENDFLILGLSQEFLYTHPELYLLPIAKAAELFHAENALVIQAHPARLPVCFPSDPRCLDGFELMNGNPRWGQDPGILQRFARENPRLIRTSGTDFHQSEDPISGGVLLHNRVSDIHELTRALRTPGAFSLLGEQEEIGSPSHQEAVAQWFQR